MPVEKKTLYADFAALGDICGLQLGYAPPQEGVSASEPPCFTIQDIFFNPSLTVFS